MSNLADTECQVCKTGGELVTDDQIISLSKEVPEWAISETNDVKRLSRLFKFKDFQAALDFTNKVGELAESQGHHPAITTEWGRVKVQWWTHKIKGLHRDDFAMAVKTDLIIKETEK